MQNRYVGDIGDFAKYALLRRLAGTSSEQPIRLGVVWCLYPDESHNTDGRHISYLGRPAFAALDFELISALQKIVGSHCRSIASVANARILPPKTIFCDALSCLPKGTPATRGDRLLYRSRWAESCLNLTAAAELIFFDPDNGIEVSSVPKHSAKGGKYIYWDEARAVLGPRPGTPHLSSPHSTLRRRPKCPVAHSWKYFGQRSKTIAAFGASNGIATTGLRGRQWRPISQQPRW